jgi:Fic family protein
MSIDIQQNTDENKFKHIDLRLVFPPFNTPLTDRIMELNYLRRRTLSGSTNATIFFQLKSIFHILESLASTHIEGNNTTLAEYIETKLDSKRSENATINEIQNLEKALDFIDKHITNGTITETFLSELHKQVVDGLPSPPDGEGDPTPGKYRMKSIRIRNSKLIPPEPALLNSYMGELVEFVNRADEQKYDLLKIAIAHHRFVWIHPFSNGNGRTVRLFTYALLVKQGFHVEKGRILNPTAIFCNDRNEYYDFLSLADSGEEDKILQWCDYVLSGLQEEIEKIDKLLDYGYLKDKILIPTISYSLENKWISEVDSKILRQAIEHQILEARHIREIFPNKGSTEVSRYIRRLIEKNMLVPIKDGGRKYTIFFISNYLFRGIAKFLNENGFVPGPEKPSDKKK